MTSPGGPVLRIGCGAFTGQSSPEDGPAAGTDPRAIVGYAELAEAEGYDGFWVSEHHFAADGYTSALFPLLGAIAARTDRLLLGTRVTLAPLHPALLLAEDAAQVAHLSGGRFVLGLAIGYRPGEFEALGVPRTERVARLVEIVELCRKAWTGEPFDHDGPTVSARDLVCRPAPPIPPQLWIGGRAPAALERAGRLGDGYSAGVGATPDDLRALVDVIDASTPAARRPMPIGTGRMVVLETDARATAVMETGLASVLHTYGEWKQEDGVDPATTVAGLGRGVVRGTPEAVAAALAPLCDAFADREHHLSVRLEYPGMSVADVERHVTVFASEVIPRLRAHADHGDSHRAG